MRETSTSRSAVSIELESRSTDLWQTQTDRWTQLGHGIYSDSTATCGKKRKTPIFPYSGGVWSPLSTVHGKSVSLFISKTVFQIRWILLPLKCADLGGNAIIEVKLLLKLQNPLIPPNLKHWLFMIHLITDVCLAAILPLISSRLGHRLEWVIASETILTSSRSNLLISWPRPMYVVSDWPAQWLGSLVIDQCDQPIGLDALAVSSVAWQ